MTRNQIEYMKAVEQRRAARVNEELTLRRDTHTATARYMELGETNRHNLATEDVAAQDARSRSTQAKAAMSTAASKAAEVQEKIVHDRATESAEQQKIGVTQAQLNEAIRHNIELETEQRRSNTTAEWLTAQGQQINAETQRRGQDVAAAASRYGADRSAAATERGQDINATTQRLGQGLNYLGGMASRLIQTREASTQSRNADTAAKNAATAAYQAETARMEIPIKQQQADAASLGAEAKSRSASTSGLKDVISTGAMLISLTGG